ncbi:hypothetical protein PCH_Pc21g16270 [Penicillium rubens Wisconsin 54-1255]|uniref:Uncharacterized protein n=1 Tax=Penicillium rubens (strain ATCC 28089 / DSM 1075 / NRRL 1951 / Wisconsin 54-1255) TaxID=500485 RepID=B6HKY5_PENRW|nr:hypothetical protein PCH_Pc21g16270 [Penicillium rubens Wisconsin 54-1255]
MVEYLGTDTTGTEMKYGQESRLRGQLARQNAGDNGGKYRGQCTRRPRQEEPKTKDGSSQIQYNPVECASPQSATCRPWPESEPEIERDGAGTQTPGHARPAILTRKERNISQGMRNTESARNRESKELKRRSTLRACAVLTTPFEHLLHLVHWYG